jgi:hypothetical protein
VEITCAAGIAPGSAYLDDASETFPEDGSELFALFLDWGNALVVTRTDGRLPEYLGGDEDDFQKRARTGNEWKRVGLARFIWTPSQREAANVRGPGGMAPNSRGVQCHGPITDGDERVLVTLV